MDADLEKSPSQFSEFQIFFSWLHGFLIIFLIS